MDDIARLKHALTMEPLLTAAFGEAGTGTREFRDASFLSNLEKALEIPTRLDMSARGLSKTAVGMVFALNGILIVFLQPAISPLLAPHNRSRVLALGTATIGLGFGLHDQAMGRGGLQRMTTTKRPALRGSQGLHHTSKPGDDHSLTTPRITPYAGSSGGN